MKNSSRLPSPALVLSIVALVLALTGSAVAAKRYLITNTKQISPQVLKQLAKLSAAQGAAGAPGATGAAGTPGAAGAAGKEGAAGAAGTEGAAGKEGAAGTAGAKGAEGPPGPRSDLLWAVVEPGGKGGEVARGSEPGITSDETAQGTNIVRFENFGDVTQCAYEASIGLASQTGTAFPGFATVVRFSEDANAVYVQTFNAKGEAAQLGFHLAILC
jgi:hypothetical protein